MRLPRRSDGESTCRAAACDGPRLSTRLLVLTMLFVVFAELLVFVPSIAHFRINRIGETIRRADLVVMALGPGRDIDRALQDDLLAALDASAVSVRTGEMRRLVAMAEQPTRIDRVVDTTSLDPWTPIVDVVDMLFAGDGRRLRILGPPNDKGQVVDLVVSETPIRAATLAFAGRLLVLSAVLLGLVAALVFLGLRRLILVPLRRLAQSMVDFAADPENPARVIRPSGRTDEIGEAERRLAEMQSELAGSLAQKKHLADLGVAVSKINHDLRNVLASAQLITDRLTTVPDATVQRFAPKLLATLDRAIAYSRAVLDYGKTGEAPPERRLISLARLVADVAELLGARDGGGHGLAFDDGIRLAVDVADDVEIDADPDQIFRVILNLMRNAMQALEGDHDPSLVRRVTVSAQRQGTVVVLRVADTGPGVPAKAKENLFRPFQGGFRRGGTGLGLAICAELVRAHGGTIDLVDAGPGATFEVAIPDRVIDLADFGRRRSSRP
jgi:signal transduction histidine kinase